MVLLRFGFEFDLFFLWGKFVDECDNKVIYIYVNKRVGISFNFFIE